MANTLMIVSDISDGDSEEDIYILRHSHDIQSRNTSFNVHPIAIGGARVEREQNGRPPVSPGSDINSNSVDRCSTKPFGMVHFEVAENVVHFSDLELSNDEQGGVSYRKNVPQPEATELERNNVFKEKKKNIILNLILLGAVIFLQSVGFSLYYMDMTLLNVNDIITQRITYIVLLFMTMLSTVLSLVIINAIGPKWTVFIGCIGAALFTIAKFFATMGFMIPAAIIGGATMGPFLVSILTYMVLLAKEYSSLSGKDFIDIICYFNGFITACGLLAPTFSSLLRYIFLSSEVTRSFKDIAQCACMKHFCWTQAYGLALFEQEEYHVREAADDYLLQALLGCYLVCTSGGGVLIWLNTTGESSSISTSQSGYTEEQESCFKHRCKCKQLQYDKSWLVAPMKMFCDANMMLLMLLCVYLGAQQYFMYSVFLQTFSQCSSQLFHSLVMAISISLVSGCCSLATPPIITQFGKMKILLPSLVVQLVMLIVMVSFSDMTIPVLYVISAFWAAAEALIHNTILVVCTDVFFENMESSFVCLRFSQVTGFLFVTTLQLFHMCNQAILIFVMCILILAGLCYVVMRIKLGLEKRESRTHSGHYLPLLRDPSWLPDVNPVEVRRERTTSLSSRVPTFE